MKNQIPTEPNQTLAEYLTVLQRQFQGIAIADEPNVIAAYQSLNTVCELTQMASYDSMEHALRVKSDNLRQAAVARMHALMLEETDGKERGRLRKVFFRATNDVTFRWFWLR